MIEKVFTQRNWVFLDFEYTDSAEKDLRVFCVAWEVWEGGLQTSARQMWFDTKDDARAFRREMRPYIDANYIFVSYSVEAEASSFYSLGLHPFKGMKWVDLYLEYRMLLNKNDKYSYGKQLIDGKEKVTVPPKLYEKSGDTGKSQKPNSGLAAACYKLLDVKVDTAHKKEMRALIISGGPFSERQKEAILEYCRQDVVHLKSLLLKMWATIRGLYKNLAEKKSYFREALLRGDYAARTAYLVRVGQPFDYVGAKNFSSHVGTILYELQKELSENFPEVDPYRFSHKDGLFHKNQNKIQDWIRANFEKKGKLDWVLTATGQPSLALDAFTKKFTARHDYPDDCFGSQYVRFLKTQQSLNGFIPGKSKNLFWDFVGRDKRVRPYMGIYGSQSARSQPKATSFIPLKSAWMRSLLQPPKGKCYISVDYSSQEFLIAALLSGDRSMVKAYHSGDPYMYTAILAKAAPKNATKATHGLIREKFKSTVLGIQYLMGIESLARKLTHDTGQAHFPDDAQRLIRLFEGAYPVYNEWRWQYVEQYKAKGYARLPCGWTMWGDNPNDRSTANYPVQGHGSSIMREAVRRAQDSGVQVAFTLHDELCILARTEDVVDAADILATSMSEAFINTFKKFPRRAATCRLGAKIWGPDFKEGQKITTRFFPDQEVSPLHIDKRAIRDYERFKQYFTYKDETLELMQLLGTPPKREIS